MQCQDEGNGFTLAEFRLGWDFILWIHIISYFSQSFICE